MSIKIINNFQGDLTNVLPKTTSPATAITALSLLQAVLLFYS